ncbi:MAG: DNA replication/repair protein RecF [Pleurocapsa minor GSE-CHR-MK-17-07R]|nr:DNA replication/repair protein RecF [Pleurocapsa minor GSE-CHR-MK 17-07R]
MRLTHLSLTNFRNYARLELMLPESKPVLIVGQNAQGKTNLLEAIYYLAAIKSPYTQHDRQLIHWRTENEPIPFARIAGDIQTREHTSARLEITLMIERVGETGGRFRKVIRLNGVEKRALDVIGTFNVVLFLPQDLTLIEGGPSDRRRFIDDTLGQVDAVYAQALETYEKVLPQRNALLRRIAERSANAKELPYWDEQIAQAGAVIIAGRQRFLREMEYDAQKSHYDLTGRREMLTMRYQPSFAPTAEGNGQLSFGALGLDLHRDIDPARIVPQFLARLKDEQAESIARGATVSGPHRDELRLLINDRDIGLYGSRGQARTAVMACKLAELSWMRERIGEWPVLLLDEVAAELDASRRAYLLERIDGVTQTLATTTEQDIFTTQFLERAALWRVTEGELAAE